MKLWRCAFVLLIAFLTLSGRPAQADGPNHAALIIAHGDGHVTWHCVSFDESQISGGELLRRSGLAVRFTGYTGFGAGVCAIDGEGCLQENQDCFCQCPGATCLYWSYWHWRDGRWVYSQVGADSYQVHSGDVEGWIWGDAQTPPPFTPFEAICQPPATPTPTAMPPTITPEPTHTTPPTATPEPTHAPAPTSLPPTAPASTPTLTLSATPGVQPTATQVHTATRTPHAQYTSTAAPTNTPTNTPTATATCSPTSTSRPTETPTTVTAPTPTLQDNSIPAAGQRVPIAQYLLFGAMAILLLGVFWLLQKRRKG